MRVKTELGGSQFSSFCGNVERRGGEGRGQQKREAEEMGGGRRRGEGGGGTLIFPLKQKYFKN